MEHHMQNKKALLMSFVIITAFMIIEFIGGVMTNSLALFSDAGHMLSDSISLGVGLLAFKFGEKAVNDRKSFGYQRMEILAALFNGVLLIVISILIMWEAFQRFGNPQGVSSNGMLVVATIGAVVNILVAWILLRADTKENINIRATFLHVLGDLLGSIGAIIAALLIMYFDWKIADPIASLIVALIILKGGFGVSKDAVHVLMEGTPEHLDVKMIRERLLQIPDVVGVHDFHIWNITSDFPSISCHLVISSAQHDVVLKEALTALHDIFGLEHATIQVENKSANLDQYEHHCCNSYEGYHVISK
ncbi:cation diffusion facilitator family transporter [Rummeliibacillus sp. SL167]|uniref:cation diffusion facilitator family transporter n=1 Tax=Rummeliibacillus sp. SL167 TaxID=2579792 RepID=UPI0011B44A70|nr:cation diffusion facilitator family transporter [Rummeliibacillus sp. SL167]